MDTSTFRLNLDPNKPEGNRKSLGGGKADEWNDRLSHLTFNALPIAHSKNEESITAACEAVSYGAMDIAPADPVEGILIAQLMAANEAALDGLEVARQPEGRTGIIGTVSARKRRSRQ